MKLSMSFTNAHIKLPAKKMAFDHNSMGLRPQISESLPHNGVLAVCARVNDVPIQA